MFFFKSVFLFLTMFSAEIGVYSQMDVILKRATAKPILHNKFPSGEDADPESSNNSPETQELLKHHERLQDELRKIGVQMDNAINSNFDFFPHPLHQSILDHILKEHRQIHDKMALPDFGKSMNSDDSDPILISDIQSPLRDFVKFMDDSMHPFGPRVSVGAGNTLKINKQESSEEEVNEDLQPVGVLTIIKINDDAPLQDGVVGSVKDDVKKTLDEPEMGSTLMQGFLDGIVGAMNDMVGIVRNTSISMSAGGTGNQNCTEPQVDIVIRDHGKIYDIPHNAYVERTEPDLVNITWRSELKDLNNSLCMNVSKDADGRLVFHHIRLRMMNGQGLKEYNKEDPVHIGKDKENRTEINLADGIGLEFPHPDSLDVVVVEKRGKFSSHWMAVSIALLGLIVAGLIMLLSYVLHSRNRYHSRKDSISKAPIA